LEPPVKLAIVGCGAVTESKHLPAAQQSRLVSITALVDSRIDKARAVAAKYSLQACTISSDLELVIASAEGVLIATPNDSHFSIAQLALSHGIPVLVEKPFTISYADAIALCELAERQHTFISVGYMSRHYRSVRLLRHLLETGYLGKITYFHYELGIAGAWESSSGYKLDPRRAGGGTLIVQGTHFLDRMLHLFGYPESFTYSDDNHGGVEANCSAKLHFNNESGSFDGSFLISSTRHLKNCLTLRTEHYTCVLDEYKTESLRLFPSNQPGVTLLAYSRDSNDGPAPSHIQIQLEEFASLIRKGGRPTVDGCAAAQTVKLIEEMYRHRTQMAEPWLTYRAKLPGHSESHV
jgi:predicted dehydrogenase